MIVRRVLMFLALLVIGSHYDSAFGQEAPSCEIVPEKLTEFLYLDTTLVPKEFDREMLIRLYDFLRVHVVSDSRSPYPDYVRRLPVIVRYVDYSSAGTFPETTEGNAGWCDVVIVNCHCLLTGMNNCTMTPTQLDAAKPTAFLALIALPNEAAADEYVPQLWGITAHELTHSLGAIDGPRFPFYEDHKLLSPVHPTSDTYYWFGIAGVFNPGWQGIIWDAWQGTCTDELCEQFRAEVLLQNSTAKLSG